MLTKWRVAPEEAGLKLGAFLKQKLGDQYSAKKIKQAIEANLCLVNGVVERFASKQVFAGNRVEFYIEEFQNYEKPKLKFEESRILYEDDDFFIYDKPAGITSDGKGLAELFSHCYLIHRLDKDTSGVLLFAKNSKTRLAMIDLFRKHQIKKTYLALVNGKLIKEKGRIKNYLGKVGWFEGQTVYGEVPKGEGVEACTEWSCEKSNEKLSLVRCYPITGRTHQLRVHLSSMGHPIVGDYQYGRNIKNRIHSKRCMLHAVEISFRHPRTGENLKISAIPPQDFQQIADEIVA